MDSLLSASKSFENAINPILQNPYVMAVVKISLALYAAQIAPKPPKSISNLLNNTFVKIALLILMVYLAEKDFQLAVIIAVVFVFGMNAASGRGILESFADYDSKWKPDSKLKFIEPQTHIHPGCVNIKLADLLGLFKGDKLQLQNSIHHAYQELSQNLKGTNDMQHLQKIADAIGLPFNVVLNDQNAPLIATMFVNAGFEINDSCKAPN